MNVELICLASGPASTSISFCDFEKVPFPPWVSMSSFVKISTFLHNSCPETQWKKVAPSSLPPGPVGSAAGSDNPQHRQEVGQ